MFSYHFSMRRVLGAGLGLVALGATTLPAQQPAPGARAATVITFDQALKLAQTQNVGVKQAQNAAALSSTNVTQQKLAFLPNLSVSANTGQTYGNVFNTTDGTLASTTT